MIPAAGLGTRFHPITQILPKELIPVLNIPGLQHITTEALASGITELIIINSRSKPILSEWISQFNIDHQNESISATEVIQDAPSGLGHAILQSREYIGNQPFGVMLPDDIIFSAVPTLRRMINMHANLDNPILCIKEVPCHLLKNYGVIKKEADKITNIVEKPEPNEAPSNLSVIGRYILDPTIFQHLECAQPTLNNEIQLTDSLNQMMKTQDFHAHMVQGHHFDIGTPKGLISASIFASQNPTLVTGLYK